MTDVVARLGAALAGRYVVERELGAGGMATVYLAHDVRHDRKVALKVLRPELSAILGGARFLHEIKTTANLQHPHILGLFDSGEADGTVFYVMPFVDGESLRDRLTREKQLPVDEAVRIAKEVADALHYAHGHGIVHRDIKPENIMLHGGHAMVADFGIALAASRSDGATRMTETGMSLGTPHYMAPEQAMGEREITHRADVYALGCVLYEMLTGEPPFTGPTAQAIIARVMTEEPRSLTLQRRTVPPHVEAAVAMALAKLPADRFGSAADFAAALGNATFAAPASGRLPPGPFTPRRAVVVPWVVVALVATAGAIGSLRPRGPAGPSEYDVALPDSVDPRVDDGAPSGDFVVYQAPRGGRGELWFRSLRDATTQRISGTEDGWQPAISPDGVRIAFLRDRGDDRTLEVMPVAGGGSTTLGRASPTARLQWLADGRLLVIEEDGKRARWVDPGGGPSRSAVITYCINAAPLPDARRLLCGGGGDKWGYWIETDSGAGRRSPRGRLRAADGAPVFGSHFQVLDGRYLVYVSIGGDLMAAPVDVATGVVGRAVRMEAGLGRRDYSGTGTYAVAASGTLVVAPGVNQAAGHLVRTDGRTWDTLPVGRDGFLRFAFSPDEQRLAAVVEGLEGEELRIYDLRGGRHVVWLRRPEVRQPVWSPQGDRLLFSAGDSVYVGSPDLSAAPDFVFEAGQMFEGFEWLPDGRVVGGLWGSNGAAALHPDRRPASLDTLLPEALFPRLSPDRRWIAYTDPAFGAIWLEPFPRTGRRWQVMAGSVDEAVWLSASELAVQTYEDSGTVLTRVRIGGPAGSPLGPRRPWFVMAGFLGTAGQSYTATRDGRVVYVRGPAPAPVRYLRVVPDWVNRMKRAVDEANR
jgi:eukaryotic-like serine/threonine-protein kinase